MFYFNWKHSVLLMHYQLLLISRSACLQSNPVIYITPVLVRAEMSCLSLCLLINTVFKSCHSQLNTPIGAIFDLRPLANVPSVVNLPLKCSMWNKALKYLPRRTVSDLFIYSNALFLLSKSNKAELNDKSRPGGCNL